MSEGVARFHYVIFCGGMQENRYQSYCVQMGAVDGIQT